VPRYFPSVPSPEPSWTDQRRPAAMRDLIKIMKETILSEREEMFGEGDGV
jgi:hypothetical protein